MVSQIPVADSVLSVEPPSKLAKEEEKLGNLEKPEKPARKSTAKSTGTPLKQQQEAAKNKAPEDNNQIMTGMPFRLPSLEVSLGLLPQNNNINSNHMATVNAGFVPLPHLSAMQSNPVHLPQPFLPPNNHIPVSFSAAMTTNTETAGAAAPVAGGIQPSLFYLPNNNTQAQFNTFPNNNNSSNSYS